MAEYAKRRRGLFRRFPRRTWGRKWQTYGPINHFRLTWRMSGSAIRAARMTWAAYWTNWPLTRREERWLLAPERGRKRGGEAS